jgi:hypothetical protein
MLTNDDKITLNTSINKDASFCFYGHTVYAARLDSIHVHNNENDDLLVLPKPLYENVSKIPDLYPLFEWLKLRDFAKECINRPLVYRFDDYTIYSEHKNGEIVPTKLTIQNGIHSVDRTVLCHISSIGSYNIDVSYEMITISVTKSAHYTNCHFHKLLIWCSNTPSYQSKHHNLECSTSNVAKLDSILLNDVKNARTNLQDKHTDHCDELATLTEQLEELKFKIDSQKNKIAEIKDQIILYDRIIERLEKK